MKKISIICAVAIVSATALISCGGNETKEQPVTEQPTSMVEEPVGPIVTTDSTVTVHIEGDDQMKYNVNEITAKAGQKITIHIKNVGKLPKEAMAHNFVLLKSGTDVAAYAEKAIAAKDVEYIPASESDKVIAHTKMVGPGESDTISFDAPAAGKYDYICSFPGHYGIMKGVLIVQ
ncbi:MAG TPA: azurin [Ferruginibacter sp.]|nr:azurin [Ferruginibacter sp.]HRE62316.1 azurin [Ferruginibacter sp.]